MLGIKQKLFRKDIAVSIEFLILRILLEIVYVYGLSTNYGYTNYYTVSISGIRYVVSWLLFILLIPLATEYVNRPSVSGIVYVLFFVTGYIPSSIMFAYKETPFWIWYTVYWIILSFSMKYIRIKGLKIGNNPRIVLKKSNVLMLGALFSLLTIYIWVRYAHFRVNFNLLNVYEIREEAANYNFPAIIDYLYSWVSHIMPFLVVWCLGYKKYGMAIYFIIIQLLYFFVDGSKSTLFSLGFVVVSFLILKKKPTYINKIIVAFLAIMIACIGQLVILHGGVGKILSIFVRRVFFVPAQLNYDYYNFFSTHTLNYYSNIIKFIEPIYAKGIPMEIGFFRQGFYGENANNGLFSDAYANLGVFGCFVMPVAIALLLKMFDWVCEGIDKAVLVSVMILISRPLFGASFFTSLLTHGLVFFMIVLYAMPREKGERCC